MLFTKSGNAVSKIGIGTWTIKKENIEKEVEALEYYFKQGVNYIDVVLAYDDGKVIDVVAEFLKKVKREDIYINALITNGCDNPSDIEKQINFYLENLNTSYLDCVTLHALSVIKFDIDIYNKTILSLKKQNKFLAIGYSNLSLEDLKLLPMKIDYFESVYNLECKINEDLGIIDYCKNNDIDFYAYQPLRRNRTAKQEYPEVVKLAKKYNKTQNQILINWIVKHKKIGALIKSSNKEHIKENIESLIFEMTDKDYVVLDKFRNAEFDKLKVSFKGNEEGKVGIASLANQPIGKI